LAGGRIGAAPGALKFRRRLGGLAANGENGENGE